LNAVQIILNGARHLEPAPLTVLALLTRLEIDPRTVAVEHNCVVVKRAHYATILIEDGAEIEIVAFVGGG
jgi:sulfur carrier protein